MLDKLILTQYRNYTFQAFDLKAPVIGITGINGSGKTNLLDAVYYLCYTKSYFQSREINNIQSGKNGFRLEGFWLDEFRQETSSVTCIWKEGKKIVQYNHTDYEKISDHIGRFNAVMIAPDDIALINEGSDLRRKYMDGILAQRDSQYLIFLLQYQKVLAQRNAYLKGFSGIADHKLLDVYDEQLAQYGSYLLEKRLALSQEMPALVQKFYQQISEEKEQVHIGYKSASLPQSLLETMYEARQRDTDLRRTTQGVHTEDWQFIIGNNAFKTHASQGQKKSFLISLKLAHIHLLHQLQKYPILLLDDIFEKLDKGRLSRLFASLEQFALPQTFITHTDSEELKNKLNVFKKDILMLSL